MGKGKVQVEPVNHEVGQWEVAGQSLNEIGNREVLLVEQTLKLLKCYFPLPNFSPCSATSLSPISGFALLLPSLQFQALLCYFPQLHNRVCSTTSLSPISGFGVIQNATNILLLTDVGEHTKSIILILIEIKHFAVRSAQFFGFP